MWSTPYVPPQKDLPVQYKFPNFMKWYFFFSTGWEIPQAILMPNIFVSFNITNV